MPRLRASRIRSSPILPAAGQRIGVVQIANPRDGRDFSDADARLLLIYAAQVGGMIENARLFRAVQEQVDVSESIRRIAEYAGAVNTPEDSFLPLLREVCQLTNSPQAFINIIDPETGNLRSTRNTSITSSLSRRWFITLIRRALNTASLFRAARSSAMTLTTTSASCQNIAASLISGLKTTVMVPLIVGDQSLASSASLTASSRPTAKTMCGRCKPPLSMSLPRSTAFASQDDRAKPAPPPARTGRYRAGQQRTGANARPRPTLEVIRHEAIRATEAAGSSIALLQPVSEWGREGKPKVERRLGERISGVAPLEMLAIQTPEELDHGR